MTAIQAIVLGLVQGLTEFLPVSSSAHLAFIPSLFHWQLPSQDFDIFLHAATLLAVIFYFRSDLIAMVKGIIGKDKVEQQKQLKLLLYLFIAFIVLLPFVLLFDKYINASETMLVLTFVLFILFGIPLLFIEKLYAKNKLTMQNLTWKKSLLIGCSQCLALFSGVSRSGVTIMTGLVSGLTKEEAKRFTFLLSIPTILASFVLELVKVLHNFQVVEGWGNVALGMIVALVSGWFAIRIMMRFLQNRSLAIFGYYRIILGIILLVLTLYKVI